MLKKIFSLIMIAGVAMCNLYAADDEDEEEKQIEQAIYRLTMRQRELERLMPSKKIWKRMDCYVRCVKMIESCCRYQMAGLREKTLPGGIYYASCPGKCNYGKKINHPPKRYKDISGCVHYDKNGYWFVTYVCYFHKMHWYFELANRYKLMEKRYPSYEFHRNEYRKNLKKIKQLRDED
ncbi:MAG: hypothetical protein E7051_05725 [Lentisphaerae bacterium]|nr:hypothetical protein [Lentisphaerota bacterium]